MRETLIVLFWVVVYLAIGFVVARCIIIHDRSKGITIKKEDDKNIVYVISIAFLYPFFLTIDLFTWFAANVIIGDERDKGEDE